MPAPTAQRGLLVVAFSLFLGAMLAAPAQAQGGQPPLIQVQIDGQAAGGGSEVVLKKVGAAAELTFTIGFVCKTGATEYGTCTGHQLAETDVAVRVQPTGAFPTDGWKVTGGTSEKTMKARETHVVRVTVELLTDDPTPTAFRVTLKADAMPQPPDSPLPIPIGQVLEPSSDTDNVAIREATTFAEEITHFAKTYMWPLLGAAVVLLLTGVVLVERKRGGGVALTSDQPAQDVLPGRAASFPVRLVNETRSEDRVALSVSDLPLGWDAIVPLSEYDLRASDRTQLWVTVRVPASASPGQTASFTLHARSAAGPRRDARLPLQVRVGTPEVVGAPPELPTPPPVAEFEADVEAASEPARPAPRKRIRVARR